jgi:hypothetical protein
LQVNRRIFFNFLVLGGLARIGKYRGGGLDVAIKKKFQGSAIPANNLN